MKFLGAFLTKAHKVGMQYENKKGNVLTVYSDKQGQVHVSEHSSPQETILLKSFYHLHGGKFGNAAHI